ncbi:MAG: PCRF domain-containing protein, partial [Acutalibacteraceae bacterium]
MLEFEQLKLRLEGNETELRDLKDAIGYDRLKKEIDELELKAAAPGFWDDTENSQKILQRTGKLKNTVETYERLCSTYDDLLVLIEMGDEEGDLSLVEEISASLDEFESGLASQRLQTLL